MKKLLLCSIFLVIGMVAFAEKVDRDDAKQIAKNIYFERVQHFNTIEYDEIVISEEFTISSAGVAVYYVFNIGKNEGFVIVSANDDVYPVLCYSFEGRYNENDHHPSFTAQMGLYEKQIIEIGAINPPPVAELTEVWDKYVADDFSPTKDGITVGPWCSTQWNQSPYYNDSCPGGSVTGCVATAMAQLMRSFEHPKTGKGKHSYTHPSYGIQSANFGNTVYNYKNMPDMISGPNADVAQLSYHCGVSVDMSYSPGGSGASMWTARDAFVLYFKYNPMAQMQQKNYFSDENWKILVRAEHIDGHPVMYSGPGHAFICDGFQYPDHFHFNWGWGGSYDGYYYMTNLNPGYSNYTNGQDAILNCYPDPMETESGLENQGSKVDYLADQGVELAIMPNPVVDNLNITIIHDYIGEVNCSVVDANGRTIKQLLVEKNADYYTTSINISDISEGFYFVTVNTGNEVLTSKFIVNR